MFKKLLTLVSLYLGSLLFVPSMALASSLQILTVDEPPSSFVDADGQLDGFAVDVVKAIQQELGDQTPIEVMPEIRVLKIASDTPNVMMFGFSKTAEREKNYHMISLLLRKPWVLYAKKEYQQQFDNIEEAKVASTIGVVRGDVRSIYLDQLGFENTQKVPYHELNVRMLMKDRVDMIFYEPLGLAYAVKNLGFSLDEIKSVLRPEASEVYLMMSREGTDIALVERWQAAAEKLKAEGKFKAIAEHWSEIIYQQTGVKSEAMEDALNF